MSDTKTEQEPSIEEILESIRQIISDEDQEGAAEEGGTLKGEEDMDKASDIEGELEQDDNDAADIEGALEEDSAEDVLELKDIVEEGTSADIDIDLDDPETPAADIDLNETGDDDGRILSENTEDAAVGSFAKLADNVYVDEDRGSGFVSEPGRVTLEQMTRELLRPMMKEWLDRRLPSLVEELVEKELKKISERSRK